MLTLLFNNWENYLLKHIYIMYLIEGKGEHLFENSNEGKIEKMGLAK